jgi:HEPN domain-containing protein
MFGGKIALNDAERRLVSGWADKASAHLDMAREQLRSCVRATEAIQSAQVSVELSVKAIFTILGIDFPRCHGWDEKQLGKIAKQIQDRDLQKRLAEMSLGHIRLPRLLILANFWSQFYLHAKYGIESASLAPPQDLFEHQEAELAVRHAEECTYAIASMRNLDDARVKALRA